MLALVLTLLSTGPQEASPESTFLAWATEAAVPIDLESPLPRELVEPLVAGKRVVLVGEPDHYVQEKYAVRLAFLGALHPLGWRHLGMEMGRADGIRLDRYLATGDERHLDQVRLYAAGAGARPGSGPGGFLASERAYARALRALGEGEARVRYFGFDLDLVPGSGIDDARGRLDGVAGAEELAAALEAALTSDERETELGGLLDELREPGAPLAAGLPADRLRALRLDLEVLVASLRFRRTVNLFGGGGASAFDEQALAATLAGFARREQAMFAVVDDVLATLGPDEGLVLTGHDLHLGRSWRGVRWTEPDGVALDLWPTIGAHVTERLGDEVLVVWMLVDHGVHLVPYEGHAARPFASVPGTVESLLARVPHEAFLLPLATEDGRARWLDAERPFRVNGGVGHGRLRELTDVIVFVRETHAPRPPR